MGETEPKYKWCEVKSMCGRSLKQGMIYIGVTTLVVSLISVISSLVCLTTLPCSGAPIVQQPVYAVNLVFALICSSLSIYQCLISVLLLWQCLKTKPNIFLCSLWYVSHLSILILYGVMFLARTVVCSFKKEYISAVITVIVGSTYEGIFIYFSIVVNSYIHSLDQVRYF